MASIGKRSKFQVAKSRPIVFERDGGECVIVGSIWETIQPCAGILTVQHRVGRGAGGSALWDEPKHLLTMCVLHNVLAEQSAEFANYCQRNGVSVPRWAATQFDVQSIPVRYRDGWFLLSGGQRFPVSDQTAEAMITELYDLD